MEIIGVISEFNPFHNGHKYLIDTIKNNENTAVVAIMSGNFVQRGDVAIFNKYLRAEQALKNGVDLVVELPCTYAVSNAETFGNAGVMLANALGCDKLAFGCEAKSIEGLIKIAELLCDENFQDEIKNEVQKSKSSYPSTIENAVKNHLGENYSKLLQSPNNTLAISYLKALQSTSIKPIAIQRKCVAHDDLTATNNFASASYVRNIILDKNNTCDKYIPDNISLNEENVATIGNLETAILYKLRSMTAEDFKVLPDVSEGLENRIFDAVQKYNSYEEIITNIKTKRYTLARIRRIIIYALLNITKEIQKTPVPYIRVLGFTEKGKYILSYAKKINRLPIITKVSQGLVALESGDCEILKKDIYASDIHGLATSKPQNCKSDFYNEIVKI